MPLRSARPASLHTRLFSWLMVPVLLLLPLLLKATMTMQTTMKMMK